MRWSNFASGLWLPSGLNQSVPNDSLRQADNVRYFLAQNPDTGETEVKTVTRSGRSLWSDFGSEALLSGWRHYPRSSAASSLVVYNHTGSSTARIGRDAADLGTYADVATGLTENARWAFTHWPAQDKTYLCNGFDGLKSYDGTSIASVTQSGVQMTGRPLAVWRGRLWGTRSDEANRSVYATDVNNPLSVPPAHHLNLNDREGGSLIDIVPRGDFILFLKNTSLWRFTGDIALLTDASLTNYSDYGCSNFNTVASTPYGVIYAAKDGIYLTDGYDEKPIELSRAIRSLWVDTNGNIAPYPNSYGFWFDRWQQYWWNPDPATSTDVYVLHRLPVSGNPAEALWIWSKYTNTPLCMAFLWPSESDNGRCLFGDTVGNLWLANDDAVTDAGVTVPMALWTSSRPLDSGSRREGRAYRAKVLGRWVNTITGGVRYDGASSNTVSFTPTGSASFGYQYTRNTLTDQANFGKHVSVHLSRLDSANQGTEIHAIDLDVRFRSHRVWR